MMPMPSMSSGTTAPKEALMWYASALCIVGDVAEPALSFMTTLLLQLLWCFVVKCLGCQVLSVCSFPSFCL